MDIAVIPAFEEERTIGTIVLKCLAEVDRVAVVDDGSTDGTAQVARMAGAEVIENPRNEGKGRALLLGIEAALKKGADRIVILDGDGQHDPADIPRLLAPLQGEDVDLVIGSRTEEGDGDPSLARRVGRGVLDGMTNAGAGLELEDTQSGFRAAKASCLATIRPKETGMGVESEMLMAAAREDLTVVEVPVPDHYPADSPSRTPPVQHGLDVVASIGRFIRGDHPLALFGTVGTLLLAIGGYLGYQAMNNASSIAELLSVRGVLATTLVFLGCSIWVGAMILDAISLEKRGSSGG